MSSIESIESYVNHIIDIVTDMTADGQQIGDVIDNRPQMSSSDDPTDEGFCSGDGLAENILLNEKINQSEDLNDLGINSDQIQSDLNCGDNTLIAINDRINDENQLSNAVLAEKERLEQKVNELQDLTENLRKDNSLFAIKVEELESKCAESDRLVQELSDTKNMIKECQNSFAEEMNTHLTELEHKFEAECQQLGAEHQSGTSELQSKVSTLEERLKESLDSNKSLETKFKELINKLTELESVRKDNDKLVHELIAYKQELDLCRSVQEESVQQIDTRIVDKPEESDETHSRKLKKLETKKKIDHLVDLYHDFAKVPIPVSGYLFEGKNKREKLARIVWMVRDMDRSETTKFETNYSIKVTKDGNRVKDISDFKLKSYIPKDQGTDHPIHGSLYSAFVRKDGTSGKSWLEIWNTITIIKSLDMNSVEEHSSVLIDHQFGGFLWSPNGKQLLYVAEYKPPKSSKYFRKQPKESKINKNVTKGEEYLQRGDFDESFNGLVHSVIAILDIENDFKIRTIEMNGYSLGQPIWLTDNQIAFVGLNERPDCFGPTNCPIESSAVFISDLKAEDSQPICISGEGNKSVRNPRLSPDGKTIVYLENDIGGPHRRASRLLSYDLESKSMKVVFGCNGVRELIPNGNGYKYGKVCTLFVNELTENCFTSDGKHLIMTSYTELQSILCSLDLTSGQLKPIPFPTESVRLLDLKDDLLVAIGSSITSLPNIFVAKLNDGFEAIDWLEIKHNSNDCLKDITSEKFWFPSEDPKKLLTSIMISPKSITSKAAPTVVIPHSAQHSQHIDTYVLYPVLFAKLGLKTLLVNYRGSTGVDEEYVKSLVGNFGSLQVKDVMDCIKLLVDQNLIDASKLIHLGSYYGGLLATHLSGQYPGIESEAYIALNSVIDLISGLIL